MTKNRKAQCKRSTKETKIEVVLTLFAVYTKHFHETFKH